MDMIHFVISDRKITVGFFLASEGTCNNKEPGLHPQRHFQQTEKKMGWPMPVTNKITFDQELHALVNVICKMWRSFPINPFSPVLSPIEHLWDMFEHQIHV
ncbi:hypothetical protein TNCV_1647581 [Trichonephila clavipes]|nr:hypothetical protein TNCV_1647581 [Trichonephila clavipes]